MNPSLLFHPLSDDTKGRDDGSSDGASIAGGIIGVLLAVVFVIAIMVLIVWRVRRWVMEVCLFFQFGFLFNKQNYSISVDIRKFPLRHHVYTVGYIFVYADALIIVLRNSSKKKDEVVYDGYYATISDGVKKPTGKQFQS